MTACRGSHQTALSCMCKRACVVSVREKAFLRGGQVWVKEVNGSEPLDEMSKISSICSIKTGEIIG